MEMKQWLLFLLVINRTWNKSRVWENLFFYKRREVSFDEASDFSEKNQITYVETSAKTGFNVAEVLN